MAPLAPSHHCQHLLASSDLTPVYAQASTAPLQNLSSKLTKARHCLHNVNLNVESIKNDCDGMRREVERSDREISAMEQDEERLKLQYVESKLQYEKLHASKYAKQQELKRAREEKTRTGKERDMVRGAIEVWSPVKSHSDAHGVEARAWGCLRRVVMPPTTECRRGSSSGPRLTRSTQRSRRWHRCWLRSSRRSRRTRKPIGGGFR